MKAPRFDALARKVGSRPNRRGLSKGMLALATGLWALQRGASTGAAQEFWPCPDGVDGHGLDCNCACRRYSNAFSGAACQEACLACQGHFLPICFDVDERGDPTGEPICCADGRPCRLVCGDCPDCEPLPDLT